MQIVIDIDEELYKNVIDKTRNGYLGSDVWIAVANGTPLPKRRGDLVDRTAILDEMALTPVAERNFNSCVECVECVPTIIKADDEVN